MDTMIKPISKITKSFVIFIVCFWVKSSYITTFKKGRAKQPFAKQPFAKRLNQNE
jgi:hypothetical protein